MNINLASHIYTILFQQETVIFPNFGGLVSSYNPASVDYVQGIIYPPSKTLTFNERMVSNDGILEHFVRTQFELTADESRQVIESFITDITEVLDRGEIVVFHKVGRLYKNYERKLQFLQENTNFNKDTYGLPAVKFHPILRSIEGTRTTDALKPIEHPKMVGQPKRMTKWLQAAMPILIGCAVVSIAISLYFLQPVPQVTEDNQLQRLPVVETRINERPEMDRAMVGEAQDNRMKERYENTLLEKPSSTEKIIETESPSLAPSTKECVIIIGAFKLKAGVQTSIEKVYDLGYDAYQDKKNGLTRVGIQLAYENEKDIERALKNIRKKINKKAWIFRK